MGKTIESVDLEPCASCGETEFNENAVEIADGSSKESSMRIYECSNCGAVGRAYFYLTQPEVEVDGDLFEE